MISFARVAISRFLQSVSERFGLCMSLLSRRSHGAICNFMSIKRPDPFFVALIVLSSFVTLSNAEDLRSNAQPALEEFELADGLRLEPAALPGIIRWPIAAFLDRDQSLVVAECNWNRQSLQDQLTSKPHRIVRLVDADQDGVFDQRKVIADDLSFPEGICQVGDGLMVATPPQITKLSDLDRDGFFETHSVWYDGKSLTKCGNDLHGPMLGPDGWIYWTKAAFAEQSTSIRGRNEATCLSSSKASHLYRRHPDGGTVERLMTGGMDNLVDVAFTPTGERLFVATFLHFPRNGLRDGVGHAMRGATFGKDHAVLQGHPRTGPLMSPVVELGPAAPASIDIVSGTMIPTIVGMDSGDQAIFAVTTQFNLQKVGIHRLINQGGTFVAETKDLVRCNRVDFHPVDTVNEPNGSLLILDTGGWYDLCCPSSGSDQAIAEGGIYRLSATHSESPKKFESGSPARFLTERELIEQIHNRNLSYEQRLDLVWQLSRRLIADPGSPSIQACLLGQLQDSDPKIQQAICHLCQLYRWSAALPQLERLALNDNQACARAAIEALGVIGSDKTIDVLLKSAEKFGSHRAMDHSIVFALIELEQIETLKERIASVKDHRAMSALLRAIQQVRDAKEALLTIENATLLENPEVDLMRWTLPLVGWLENDDATLRLLVLDTLAHNTQGIDACRPYLETTWEKRSLPQLEILGPFLRRTIDSSTTNSIMIGWLEDTATHPERVEHLSAVLSQFEGVQLPDAWAQSLEKLIRVLPSPELKTLCMSLAKVRFSKTIASSIQRLLLHRLTEAPIDSKLSWAIVSACPEKVQAEQLGSLLSVEQVFSNEPTLDAALLQNLPRVRLSEKQALSWIPMLKQLPPLQLQPILEALFEAESKTVDREVVDALRGLATIRLLDTTPLRKRLAVRSPDQANRLDQMVAEANQPPADLQQSIDQWLLKLPTGDANRGNQVFRSSRGTCSACHQIGYVGGNLGPELSRIGKSRTRRDLIEAILFPSHRIAQGFQSVSILTNDSSVVTGLVIRETETQIVLAAGVNTITTINKDEIESRKESPQSLMPAGLEQQLSLQELSDLITFLEQKR